MLFSLRSSVNYLLLMTSLVTLYLMLGKLSMHDDARTAGRRRLVSDVKLPDIVHDNAGFPLHDGIVDEDIDEEQDGGDSQDGDEHIDDADGGDDDEVKRDYADDDAVPVEVQAVESSPVQEHMTSKPDWKDQYWCRVNCTTGVPCEYKDEVDLRIILIVATRPESLQKCFKVSAS